MISDALDVIDIGGWLTAADDLADRVGGEHLSAQPTPSSIVATLPTSFTLSVDLRLAIGLCQCSWLLTSGAVKGSAHRHRSTYQ
jgi:hypothetical protein